LFAFTEQLGYGADNAHARSGLPIIPVYALPIIPIEQSRRWSHVCRLDAHFSNRDWFSDVAIPIRRAGLAQNLKAEAW